MVAEKCLGEEAGFGIIVRWRRLGVGGWSGGKLCGKWARVEGKTTEKQRRYSVCVRACMLSP